MAILDADKEGFLRSERSLIQTIGRAARNLHGRAILYADKMTGSMERAMSETDRRREKQEAFNKEHNITPKSVTKRIADIMEGAYSGSAGNAKKFAKIAEDIMQYAALSPSELAKKIKILEKQMLQHAQNLEFEEAANLRDQIQQIQDSSLGLS